LRNRLAGDILDQAAFVYINGRSLKKLGTRAHTYNTMGVNAEDPEVEKELYANVVEVDCLVYASVRSRRC
jgi:hypothetical protein